MSCLKIIFPLFALALTGCAVSNDHTDVGKFGLAYKSNIQRKLNNQYYTEAEASLARGRVTGAVEIVEKDAKNFCAAQGRQVEVVNLDRQARMLHGVARLTFMCK